MKRTTWRMQVICAAVSPLLGLASTLAVAGEPRTPMPTAPTLYYACMSAAGNNPSNSAEYDSAAFARKNPGPVYKDHYELNVKMTAAFDEYITQKYSFHGLVNCGTPPAAAATARAGGERLPNSIAVLPFANISSDPDNDYFCDGISEEILNALSEFRELDVIGRTSSFAFKGSDAGIDRISAVLGVSHVLQGSVRKAGNRLRISAQLLDHTGRQLWTETFDRELANVFDIQEEIAKRWQRRQPRGWCRARRSVITRTSRPTTITWPAASCCTGARRNPLSRNCSARSTSIQRSRRLTPNGRLAGCAAIRRRKTSKRDARRSSVRSSCSRSCCARRRRVASS